MLFKLSIKNIKRSFKDYTIYFFTLVLGVCIFYIFNAIESQTVLINITSSSYDVIKLMINAMSYISVFVSFVLGFLIIYANQFLIKRRNKEFGVYLILGMNKRKVSLILFLETVLIGIISLLVGITLGFFLSQFVSVLISNMFETDMSQFKFIFSLQSCVKTLICFSIIYLIVIIFNVIVIKKCKLIDLLNLNKKSEKIKIKNPFICAIVFVISVCLLIYAYYTVAFNAQNANGNIDLLIPILLGALGTFLFFWSASGVILKIFMSIKRVYLKGLNLFTFRQMRSKINTMVFSTTVICLMLFFTICILSSSFTISYSMSKNMNELVPADIVLSSKIYQNDDPLTGKLSQTAIENSKLGIKGTLSKLNFNLDDYLKESVDVNACFDNNLTLAKTLGNTFDNTNKQITSGFNSQLEEVMTISDYNKVAKIYGNPQYSLDKNQYIIVANYKYMVNLRNAALKNHQIINVFGHDLTPKYEQCQNGFITMSSSFSNAGIIIVADSVVTGQNPSYNYVIGNYKTTDKQEKLEIEDKLNALINNPPNDYVMPTMKTKLYIKENSLGLSAMVTFIGLYLGVVFLISSAAVLALKELADSTDNKHRFTMIRKIGASEKMINRALFKQVGIFFASPFILALIHSIFGIKFCSYILSAFGAGDLLASILTTILFLTLIYGGYFLLTYLCCKNIIKEK